MDSEICKCGDLREHHINLDKYTGMQITDALRELIISDARRHMIIFGNMCLNYQQDNLRFLENESFKREGGDKHE